MAWGLALCVLLLLLADKTLVVGAQMSSGLGSPPQLPPRPPSVRTAWTLFGAVKNDIPFECDDCISRLDNKMGSVLKNTHAELAWCVLNCALKNRYKQPQFAEAFLGNINRWLQALVANYYMPSEVLCGAWTARAQSLVEYKALAACDPRCNGEFPPRGDASMQDAPCVLAPGHISITPVLFSSFEHVQTFLSTDNARRFISNNLQSSARQSNVLFAEAHWRSADAGAGVCAPCSDGACLRLHTVHMTGGGGLFTMADLPAQRRITVFGTTEYVSLNAQQLKDQFRQWAAEEPFLERMRRQSRQPESQRVCGAGVSGACLANKGAVTGRACSFQNRCFSRATVFGAGFAHLRSTAPFVVRGGHAGALSWFSGHECTAPFSTEHVYSFDDQRNSFKINVALQCAACPDTQATSGFDPDSGARRCGDAFSPFVLELALASHTGCSDSLAMMQLVECDLHEVSLRRRPQDRLRCAGCASLLAEDGFARGSHRPFITNGCRTCVENARRGSSPGGASAACGRCDDCRNCSASSTFDPMRDDFCRPLDSVGVLALAAWAAEPAAWPGGRRLAGADQFKRSEYQPAALDADHFRDAAFQQQRCRCSNRHKYAQFCGAYALRDQDAWMTRGEGEERRLSLFTDAGMLATYVIKRDGVCQPCLACPTEHFNGRCESGREGACALCRTLASCTAVANPYLHHEHALGCAQTIALSDYECRECDVWAKIGADHLLLVGCGNQDLRRWTPTARAFDGVLEVGECRFEHAPGAAASAVCSHAGAALQRQRPFGNHSALMPYCPPGWFFRCADRPSTAPWDPECCQKCEMCPPERSKNTATWRACSGASAFDTQSSNCVDRCENNMYEVNNTCLFCTTCKEGEL